MPTRNVVLSSQEVSLIERLVQSGRYRNADHVLKEGLRLIRSKETHRVDEVERRHPSYEGTAEAAVTRSDELRALILEVRAAREAMTPLRPGELLEWRDEGRA